MESWGTEVPHLGVASPTDPPGLGHPRVELPDCFARRLILCNVTLFFYYHQQALYGISPPGLNRGLECLSLSRTLVD